MTISVGVAERSGDSDLAADLYHRADQCLYAAKAVRATPCDVATVDEPTVPVGA